ncbi:hypothetical protein BDZ45DRAFT_687593 [Acephala macrosclerotiorum]|nr:hypothetical protein BDZ45DRAFT_687593 [Acephala macrosclerotiorum]
MEFERFLPEDERRAIQAWLDKRKEKWEQVGAENIEFLYHILQASVLRNRATSAHLKSIPMRVFKAASLLSGSPLPQEFQTLTIKRSFNQSIPFNMLFSNFKHFKLLPTEIQLEILSRLQIHEADKQIRYWFPHLIRSWVPSIPVYFSHWFCDLCSVENMWFAGRKIETKYLSYEFYRPRNLDFHPDTPHISCGASSTWTAGDEDTPLFRGSDLQELISLEKLDRTTMPNGPVGCKTRPMKHLEELYWYRRMVRSSNRQGSWLPETYWLPSKAPRVFLFPLDEEDQNIHQLIELFKSMTVPPFIPQSYPQPRKQGVTPWLLVYPDEIDCILDNMDVVMKPTLILNHSMVIERVNTELWSAPEVARELSCALGKVSGKEYWRGESQHEKQLWKAAARSRQPQERNGSHYESSSSSHWPFEHTRAEQPKPKAKTWASHLFG